MGGYGSGGHNRRKNSVGSAVRLDSYYFSKRIQRVNLTGNECLEGNMCWGKGNEASIIVLRNKVILSYTAKTNTGTEEIRETYGFERVANNYGGAERIYIRCPYCLRRVRYIYLSGKHFKCRICAKLNYKSQQATKNWELASYKLKKYIREKFDGSEELAPIEAGGYIAERPKGMHRRRYRKIQSELERLQEEYNEQYLVGAMRIINRSQKLGEL